MPQDTVNLLDLDEASFAKLYAGRVEPILHAGEADRLAAMTTYVVRRNWGIAAAVAVGAVFFGVWGDVLNALIAGGLTIAVAHWYAYQPLQAVATATKVRSLTAIAEAFGCRYSLGARPDALPKFFEMELLPSCDRSNYQDRFAGDHRGCAFAFCDGHLERRVKTKNGSRWQTVFRGQLIRIAFPKDFGGVTVVRRDAGIFNVLQRWTTKLQRVGLGDARLERAFEVYSNDQVEARYLIHPVFMERLLELETQFKGKKLRCAFVAGDLLIAIEGGDKFEIGTMFARLDDISRARGLCADIVGILRVIEAVLTAEQSALPPASNETGPASAGPV